MGAGKEIEVEFQDKQMQITCTCSYITDCYQISLQWPSILP